MVQIMPFSAHPEPCIERLCEPIGPPLTELFVSIGFEAIPGCLAEKLNGVHFRGAVQAEVIMPDACYSTSMR
jgi:hypothetical protein